MSGPKSGSYRVVSESELRRRREQAAQAALRPATRRWEECAHRATRLGLTFTPPLLVLQSDEIGNATRQADEIRAATAKLRAECVAQEERRARERMFEAVFWSTDDAGLAPVDRQEYANFLRRMAMGGADAAVPARESGDWRTAASETVARILGRVPPDTPESACHTIESLAQRALAADTPGDADRLVHELRTSQAEESRAALLRAADADRTTRIAAELARLDDISGADADRMRALLARQQQTPTTPVSHLSQDVTSIIERARAVQDRNFATVSVIAALAELGYDTEVGFETALAAGKPVHVARSEWSTHAIRVEANADHRLRLCPVRTEVAEYSSSEDVDVERQFCHDLDRAMPILVERGLVWDVDRRTPPGKNPVMTVRPGEPGEEFLIARHSASQPRAADSQSARMRRPAAPPQLRSRPLPGRDGQ